MKLSKIKAICKGAAEYITVNHPEGSQFLGTYTALYEIGDVRLDAATIATMFELKPSTVEMATFGERQELNIYIRADLNETRIAPLEFEILTPAGLPMSTYVLCGNELICIYKSYLAPLDGQKDINLYVREIQGRRFAVAKQGYKVIATFPICNLEENGTLIKLETVAHLLECQGREEKNDDPDDE